MEDGLQWCQCHHQALQGGTEKKTKHQFFVAKESGLKQRVMAPQIERVD